MIQKNTILIVVTGALAVAGLIWVVFSGTVPLERITRIFGGSDASRTTQEEALPEVVVTDGGRFESNVANLRGQLPQGWRIVERNAPPPLEGFDYVSMALAQEGGTCAIIGTTPSGRNLDAYKQISFAERLYKDDWQWDGSWFAPKSTYGDYEFAGDVRQYLPGEMRRSYNTRDAFVLFDVNGQSVADDCSKDLDTLLLSLEDHYQPIRLSPASHGRITVERERILYSPDGYDTHFEVLKLPTGTYAYGGSVAAIENMLYAPWAEYSSASEQFLRSALLRLDLFAGTVGVVPGTEEVDSFISSVYPLDGDIYYLRGDAILARCLDGYGTCLANLYKTPATGGEQVLLVGSVYGRNIIGFSKDEQALYLSDSTGDAGCVSMRYGRYVNGKEERFETRSGCVEGEDYANAASLRDDIQRKIENSFTPACAAGVKDGSLYPTGITASCATSIRFAQPPLLIFESPRQNAKLSATLDNEIRWKFTEPDVLEIFPHENTYVMLDIISSYGDRTGSVGDGNTLDETMATWNIASYAKSGFYTLPANTPYMISASLQYQPIDFTCAPGHGKDCRPVYSEADQTLIEKAKMYRADSGWFYVSP